MIARSIGYTGNIVCDGCRKRADEGTVYDFEAQRVNGVQVMRALLCMNCRRQLARLLTGDKS